MVVKSCRLVTALQMRRPSIQLKLANLYASRLESAANCRLRHRALRLLVVKSCRVIIALQIRQHSIQRYQTQVQNHTILLSAWPIDHVAGWEPDGTHDL